MKLKALIYCRVSSQRQVVEGHGNSSQEQRCRNRAKEKGYPVEMVFPDDGVSGGLFERPAMKQLIAYLDEHPAEDYVIIFDDLARFARDLEVHLKLRKELVGRGAKLECLNFNFEDSPEGIFIENVLASKAQLDRQQNRRQVIQKMKARLEAGYWPFCMPLGLINEQKHPIHGKILIRREPYATIYKEGIEQFRDAMLPSVLDFQKFVNEKYKESGITHRMSFESARRTLRDILYAGYIEYPKWNVPRMKAKHEGFISIETFDIVQQRLAGRAKPWHRKDYNLDFPLRPLVLCSSCNTPMTGSYHTGRSGTRRPHYYCRRSKRECPNGNRNVPKKVFEEQFTQLLAGVKPADELVDLTKDILLETWETREKDYFILESKLNSEKTEIEQKIKSYMERISKATDDAIISLYEEEIKKLIEQKKQLELQTTGNPYNDISFGTALEKVFGVIKNPMDMWLGDDYNDKRTIVFMYFEEKLRYDYFSGFGTTSLAYPINLITQKPPVKEASVEMGSLISRPKITF